ncbi:hypothetical protein HHI36_008858, partial [Cryptolaemus montrouzieri]
NRKNCSDVSVLNKVDTRSDHRVVRVCFRFDIKQERKKLIRKPRFLTIDQLGARNSEYQAEIARRSQPEETLIRMDIEQLNQQMKSSIVAATKKRCSEIRTKRGLEKGTEDHRTLNKRVKKAIRRDLRSHKTRMIQETIERNANMRVLRSKLSNEKAKLTNMKNKQ